MRSRQLQLQLAAQAFIAMQAILLTEWMQSHWRQWTEIKRHKNVLCLGFSVSRKICECCRRSLWNELLRRMHHHHQLAIEFNYLECAMFYRSKRTWRCDDVYVMAPASNIQHPSLDACFLCPFVSHFLSVWTLDACEHFPAELHTTHVDNQHVRCSCPSPMAVAQRIAQIFAKLVSQRWHTPTAIIIIIHPAMFGIRRCSLGARVLSEDYLNYVLICGTFLVVRHQH